MNLSNKKTFTGFLKLISSILAVLFWVLMMFSFEEKDIALATMLSALIHELGHIIYLLVFAHGTMNIRGAANGFRIKRRSGLNYRKSAMLCLSGPLANLITATASLYLRLWLGDFFLFFAIINLATALSNLLPIEGYDGYGALKAIADEKEFSSGFMRALSFVSTSLIFSLSVISLYLIDRFDGGYWIFSVFFISMIKKMHSDLSASERRFREI